MEQIFAGFADILTINAIIYIALGITLGIFVGAIPGLGPNMVTALAIPLTFFMDTLPAIAFLIGINKGGVYGGSISAILLNTPGTPEAAPTCFDGFPLAKQGKPEKALKIALYASVFGDTFSDLVLIMVAAPIALVALKMGPVEITALIILALTFVASFSERSLLKGLIAAAFGVFITCVGPDPMTAHPRLTMGLEELEGGIPILSLFIGVLALSEVLLQIEEYKIGGVGVISLRKGLRKEDRIVSFYEFKGCLKTILRSSIIGTAIGALPGLGSTIAAFLGYAAAKRASKEPEKFGKGALEGIAAPEAANNAVVGANLIPLFTLGIPGNVSAALLVGAFLIHGVVPGPLIFEEHGRLIYGIYGGLLIANVLNLSIGSLGLKIFAKILLIPKKIIFPLIVLLCMLGVYIVENSLFSVVLMIVFAILGYFMKKLDFSIVTFIIGVVLGPILEFSLRATLVISKNNPLIFIYHPIALFFILSTIFVIWRKGIRSKSRFLL